MTKNTKEDLKNLNRAYRIELLVAQRGETVRIFNKSNKSVPDSLGPWPKGWEYFRKGGVCRHN